MRGGRERYLSTEWIVDCGLERQRRSDNSDQGLLTWGVRDSGCEESHDVSKAFLFCVDDCTCR